MKNTNLWRGPLAITLSLALALGCLTGVANQWRGAIDGALGTSSTVNTGEKAFQSVYSTSQELVDAHYDLGERVGEESAVLLKNNGALPLSGEKPKVTLFGMGSSYPFLGGVMGSSISTSDQIALPAALQQKGFEVNPTMLTIYEAFGNVVTGTRQSWGGEVPVYGFRPAGFSTPYEPSEPAIADYTKSIEDMGGGAADNWQDSFKDYNDAAIVVFSRPGTEGSDYYPGEKGIDTNKTGATSALGLCDNERALLELAKDNFDTVIVLINSGSTMEIEELKQDDEVDALMYIAFPGAFGMLGTANVLKGTVSPSGHLPDTYAVNIAMAPAAQNFGSIELKDTSMIKWPNSLAGELPVNYPVGNEATLSANYYLIEAEGIYTGYKYYETRYYDSILGQGNANGTAGSSTGGAWEYEKEVSYPFGYGLSYTTFEQTLDNLKVDMNSRTVTANVTVKNTGSVAGKDVVQLYYQAPYTDYDKSHAVEKSAVNLLTYEKTPVIEPGKSETVTITADLKYVASWDSTAKGGQGGYILDGGDYWFSVGNGAHEAVNNIIEGQGTSVGGNTACAKSQAIGQAGAVDEKTFAQSANGTNIVNQLQNADINYYRPGYATYLTRTDWNGTFPRTYDDLTIGGDKETEWIQHLTNEVYQMRTDGNVEVAGSGGDLKFSDLTGVDDINDPRWDELVRQIPVDTLIAKIAKGGGQTDAIEEIGLPIIYQNDGPAGFGGTLNSRGNVADDPNSNFQLATMASCVTIGCTFNKDIAREWGELMGNDGLWTGDSGILGCTVNIHRCPFNGRNFEYYSEDPMLCNYLAAATVHGAGKFGIMIAPKHFAFNDQETFRAGVAPYMTEQKAREGELRAFQGPLEDAKGTGVMTSFSRIGATNVNGHWGLMREILQGEWGFVGIISTDMMDNTGYFRPEMCIYGGVTQMADFSTNETMEQVVQSWPYFTMERITKDPDLVEYARQNMKSQLYAFAHSAAQNTETIRVTPVWEAALYGAIWVSAGLSVVFAALYVVSTVKSGKKEKI